ncbi:FKBP-type peptidyl-prolyl cis-trans isomerase [Enterobacter hormaechei]|uniref:FKBP-type peptidyl-prolyl cis-trans isomerase n=1 Tax=Enterobacter hormaechei TaxID=158836 RepID=UPI0032DAF550
MSRETAVCSRKVKLARTLAGLAIVVGLNASAEIADHASSQLRPETAPATSNAGQPARGLAVSSPAAPAGEGGGGAVTATSGDEANLTAAQLREELAALQAEIRQQSASIEHLKGMVGAKGAPETGTVVPVPGGGTVSGPEPVVSLPTDGGSPGATLAPAQAVAGTSSSSASAAISDVKLPAAPVSGPAAVVTSQAPSSATSVAAPVPGTPVPSANLSTESARQSYASGVALWREVQQSLAAQRSLGITLDVSGLMKGLNDSFMNQPLQLSEDEISGALESLNESYTRQSSAQREKQLVLGTEYRKTFRKQKGTFLDAGAWYLIQDKGAGRHLLTTDMARLQITGSLPDGTVFDASGQSGQTRRVKVGAMLPAVAIGLQKVGVGGHLTVVVPPEKGYGDMGLPPAVPGGATLIFDITVKGVNEPD